MNEAETTECASEWVWVYVEAAGIGRYGRVLRKHYEAILAGNYTARFLPVEEVFWLNEGKPVRASQRGVSPLFQDTFHIQIAYISILAPVEDCTKLFLPFFSNPGVGMSAWETEQERQRVAEARKKRRRKPESASKILAA